ncbi:hypothetical protein STENM36S_03340 [Streptomyces tendae]
MEVTLQTAHVAARVVAADHLGAEAGLVGGVPRGRGRVVELELRAARQRGLRVVRDPQLGRDRVVGVAQLEVRELHVHVHGLCRQVRVRLLRAVRRGRLEGVVHQRGEGVTRFVLALGGVPGVVAGQLPDHRAADAAVHHVVGLGPDRLLVLGGEEDLLLGVPQPGGDQRRVVLAGVRAGQLRVRREAVVRDVVADDALLQVLGVPHRVGARRGLLAVGVEVVPEVVDADGAVTALVQTGARRARGGGGPAPQTVGPALDVLVAARVVRQADVDAAGRHGAAEVVVGPVGVEVADAAVLGAAVDVGGGQLGVLAVVEERGVRADVLVPGAVQVVRHDVDVVQVLLDLEGLHAAQQVPGGRRGDGEEVVPAVRGARAVELLAQRLHQGRVALDQAGPAAVREGPVERVARVLHRRRVLVVDVDAVEAVLPDEVDRRVGEGVDAGLVDRAVRLRGHRVEAARVHARAVVREVAARLGPAAHRDHRLDVRVLLLELVQQVEVALVGQSRVHLGARDPGPGHAGRRVLLAVRADGEPVAAVDVREGVVDVGDLVPRDVRGEVGRLAVLARAPAGEVPDHPARVVGAHLLPARGVVDRAVGDVDAGGLVQTVGSTGVLVGGLRGGRRETGEEEAGDGGDGREQGRPRSVAGSGA